MVRRLELVFSVVLVVSTFPVLTKSACGKERSKDIVFVKDQDFTHRQHSVGPTLQSILDSFKKATQSKNAHQKIVGGFDANDPTGGRLCWQVMMQFVQIPGRVRCGGSIIGSRTILTAGHCVSGNRANLVWAPSTLKILVGALDELYSGTNLDHGAANCAKSFSVAKVILHPQYSRDTMNNDIALVILTEDINLDATCSCEMCLTKSNPSPGEWCINSGYGQESDSGTTDRDPLPLKYIYQQMLVNWKDSRCQYDEGQIANDFVCAGGVAGTDNCYGDSGGPLACFSKGLDAYYQVGVVSYGPGTCGDGQGSRYTNVIQYLDWIVANSNGNVVLS